MKTILISGLPPAQIHRLNKLLADIANDSGCRLAATDGMYELTPAYQPSLLRKVFCKPPTEHPKVVPFRSRSNDYTPPNAA